MTENDSELADARAGRWQALARITLILFVWLLPFHSFAIALLFGLAGVSADVARTIAAWKEAAVAVLAIAAVWQALSGRARRSTLAVTDVAIGALICTGLIFLIVENPVFQANIPTGAELYAFRDVVYFMLLYYVGRSTPEIADSDRAFKHAFYVTVVISCIGILERIFVTPQMLVLLGVASYESDFLGLSAYSAGNEYGLPLNYWTWMGGVAVRRAGSVFLHSQGFALPFLLLMPAVTAFTFHRARKHRVAVMLGYAIAWTGLLLTITRMTLMICLAQTAAFFILRRRPERAVGTMALAIFAVVATLLIVPGGLHFLWETLTFQTGSSQSHLRDWVAGLEAFVERPWGHGLGTTDAPPVRFQRSPITSDNIYLSYAVQLGLAGLVALLTILGTIIARAWQTAWHGETYARRQFGIVIFLAAAGIVVNGTTSTVFSSNLLAYVFFWLAGALVTISERPRADAVTAPPASPTPTLSAVGA